VQDLRTIRRLLVIGQDDYALEAIEEAAAPFGLLVRRVGSGAPVEAALNGFGPDAVILDTELGDRPGVESLPGIRAAGAALLLLGTPDDYRARAVRERAEALGLELAGMLTKPLVPEGIEAALRALSGEFVFSASDIAAAVMRGEITAWYQPQLLRSASGWTADGGEALARWQHPEHGVVLPDAFVPVAEAEGQIAAITDCILQSSIEQLGVWHRLGLPLRVGVNLSPSLVTDPEFPLRLARLLREYGVPTRCLVLEIPEPAFAQAPMGFVALLARVRIEGFGLALEHFGRGVSSLSSLYRTPFSELKIDRHLIGLLEEDEDARRLVRGIISLAHELGLTTTAEAVQSRGALDFLYAAGCDRVQGYVVSRPLPATEFQALVGHWG
jgi:EAL domain-containing protein (putative c-di-GMP-specific phosphodiesterase class I)/CheY-like chemotaxis protein